MSQGQDSQSEPIPIETPGIEPTSGEAHSPPSSYFEKGNMSKEGDEGSMWDVDGKMKGKNYANGGWTDEEANKLPEKVEQLDIKGELPKHEGRKRLVVVGLGMVGIAFM